jgi:UDP-N-acetylmuramoyl-tripeptide--D-alanyl-D-alanine ligase
LKLNENHEFAIIEMGIIEPVQFERAAQVLEPTIAVITNIGESHLASHGDKYLIADAKVEMLRNLPKDGYAVLNIDDDLVSAMAKFSGTPNVIKFGLNKNAQFYASKIEYRGPDGIVFYVNGFYPFHLPIYSSAAIYNALTAISIARILGVEFSEMKEALENRFSLLEGTGNLIKHKKNYILDYTYDATINSVHKACESLVQFKPHSQKLILVIGDISNPGPRVEEAHLKIGYYIAALPIHTVLTIGESAEHIVNGIRQINHTNKQIYSFKNSEELIRHLPEYLEPQSTLLFTGSKKMNLKTTLNEALKLLK